MENKVENMQLSRNDGNTMLAEVVCLTTAQKLKRRGWKIGKTELRYSKDAHSSVYRKVPKSEYVYFGCDAPNYEELKKMCYSVGLIGLEEMPIEHLAQRLLDYCKRHKLKLADYDFC